MKSEKAVSLFEKTILGVWMACNIELSF